MPYDFTQRTPEITIKDRHCGYGKSTDLIASLSPDRSYLIVLPLNTEVERFKDHAPKDVVLVEPISTNDEDPAKRSMASHNRKRDHLRELLIGGHSIVTTHALFTDIAYLAQDGLLLGYDVMVDEVLSVAHSVTQEVMTGGAEGVSMQSWKGLYIEHGFATVDPNTGMVHPTEEWERKQDLPELSNTLFSMAKAQSLFAVGDNVLVWELPPILLKAVGSLTIYTFLAEGSLMAGFMRRNGIDFTHDRDLVSERKFREEAKRLIEVRDIPSINRLKFSFTGQQTMTKADHKKVSGALKNTRERLLRGVPMENLMITSAKNMWSTPTGRPGPFAVGSRMFDGPNWVPNTTRGTNRYRHCSHLIYLWDQNLNPRIAEFLGVDSQRHRDMYAISELIQWVYRSRARDGQPIILWMPSGRMRKLFQRWLDGDLELN